eukprot:SAG11_NODE_5382_length_1576_cov_2.880162_2_plen_142_part_00
MIPKFCTDHLGPALTSYISDLSASMQNAKSDTPSYFKVFQDVLDQMRHIYSRVERTDTMTRSLYLKQDDDGSLPKAIEVFHLNPPLDDTVRIKTLADLHSTLESVQAELKSCTDLQTSYRQQIYLLFAKHYFMPVSVSECE